VIPLLYPVGLLAAGWTIRAYADHKVAVEDAEDAEEDEEEETNAESVWASVTNTEGLF
jgi:phosphate-selective porin